MKEILYSAPKQNKKGIITFAILLFLLLISMVMFFQQWGNRLLSQTLVYVFGIAVIWVSVRYFFSVFTYELSYCEGEWLFLVTTKQGKRVTTLCRLPMHQLKNVSPLTLPQKPKREKKAEMQWTFHRFRQNMFPAAVCLLTFENENETVFVEIEVNEEFRLALLPFLPIAYESEDEENA